MGEVTLVLDQLEALDAGALFSPCRRWRYILWRRWDRELPACAFIGLNPSTADERYNDPTIRRCIRFAMDWGYGSLLMLNIFAFRATDPKDMKAEGQNAIGPLNNEYLRMACREADMPIAAWGIHGAFLDRGNHVRELVHPAVLRCLGVTKDGSPRHPLYLRRDTRPIMWLGRG